MKTIDIVLDKIKTQPSSPRVKLLTIFKLFLLCITGNAYTGKLKIMQYDTAFVLTINDKDIAYINIEKMEASVFNSNKFPIDLDIVDILLKIKVLFKMKCNLK